MPNPQPATRSLKARLRGVVRRFLLQLSRPAIGNQDGVNRRLDDAIVTLDQRITGLWGELASGDVMLEQVLERLDQVASGLDALRLQVLDGADEQASDRTDMRVLRSRVDLLLGDIRGRMSPLEELSNTDLLAFDEGLDALYASYTDRFGGTREEVRARRRRYVEQLRTAIGVTSSPVVDLWCARGELIELLRDNDINSYGVESNKEFVLRCEERGLDVRHEDPIEHVAHLPEASIAAVTVFDAVEHLSFEKLVRLVDASLHALRPGGMVIVEALHLRMGRAQEPRIHQRALLHADVIEFVLSARGFVDVEVPSTNPGEPVRSETRLAVTGRKARSAPA